MEHYKRFRSFLENDAGVVSIDWVVLCGVAVALGLGVLVIIEPELDNSTKVVSDTIATAVIDITSANSEEDLD